jgi:hypothetical protein
MIEHCLYGVKVFCDLPLFDRPLPLSAVAPGEHPALELRRAADNQAPRDCAEIIPFNNTHGRELSLRTDRELNRSTDGQPWCLEVENVVNFTWAGGEPVIHYLLQEEGTQALLAFWFVHIFLPLHLTLERCWDFIHSAAVEIDDQPVLFVAPSMGGKSTLGDYFLRQGHPMLSDDKVATFLHDGEFWAVPSHPHPRPFREFEVLGNPVEDFAESAKPIHAFYVLESDDPDSAVDITEFTGFRKFEQLQPNYLFSFRFLQEQRLSWLGQLADQAAVFRVRRPWNLERMPEVYGAICAHSRELVRAVV